MEECENSMGDGGSRRASFGGAFRPYAPAMAPKTAEPGFSMSSSLRVDVRRPLVARLTKDIIQTFRLCNPNFKFSEGLNPKRFLTSPSVGVLNDGFDNANSDLILYVNSMLVNSTTNQRYWVKDLLGQGTFGQVARCWIPESDSYVAVKVIKNHTAYYRQALVEVSILTMLNQKLGQEEKRHVVRILDYFIYQRHLCISFEMLGSNLYELIKMNQYRGFPLSLVQVFSKQILHALVVIKEAGIIHCDLKPENILLSTSVKPEIKVIDFGSACMEGRTVYSYIQSRYYRSPEVLLGYPYTTAIDMWSFGCIVAELFLGLPLFSGASEYDLLKRMIEILGGQPSDDLLRDAKDTDKFFKHVASICRLENDETCKEIASAYRILTEEEYEARTSQKPIIGKRYFSQVKLADIIASYPYRKNLSEEEITKENASRLALVDFLKGLVEFDPGKRWSPLQASRHPFVTGEPFMWPYRPPPETPRIAVMHAVTVNHNPGGGHWLAAGLSPQVPSLNRYLPHNSPHFHVVPVSHGSFGSLGSHGSYNDNAVLGSSYGSYGDVNNMYSYFSPVAPGGLNIQTQVGGPFLGVSPDTRRRPHMSHGNGFGMSPTGSLAPMTLGVSPSQFTPPSSQMHMSTVSPGKYGPTSPARGGVQGSPLSKTVVSQFNQFNRRRNWGYPGTSMQPHDNPSQHWQGHHGDGFSCLSDAVARGHVGSPRSTLLASNYPNLRQQTGPSSSNQAHPLASTFSTNAVASHSTEVSCDRLESSSSVPDPADWDPNYSDELLLQEDNSVVSSLVFGIANNMCLNNAKDLPLQSSSGNSSQAHSQARASSSFISSNQRTDGLIQPYSAAENSPYYPHDAHVANSRLPPFAQNSPSRFGQQYVHRHNQHSTYMHGERIHHKGQLPRGNFAMADSQSVAHTMFGSGMSWDKYRRQ